MIVEAVRAFGTRFQLVGFVPTAVAFTVLGFLAASDAPDESLSFALIDAVWHDVGWPGAIAILVIALAFSVTVQPLQYRLVQLLEGYWPWRPTQRLLRLAIARQSRRRMNLVDALVPSGDEPTPIEAARMSLAEEDLRLRFPRPNRVLPTALGNVLRAAEDRSGLRWQSDAVTLWPRLHPLLPPEHAEALEDEVTQLDLSARVCVTWAASSAAALALLLLKPSALADNPEWILVVLALASMSWLSYRGAVESALGHGRDIEVTIDLYKGLVLDALRFPDPTSLVEERELLDLTSQFLSSYDADAEWNVQYRPRSTELVTPHRPSS